MNVGAELRGAREQRGISLDQLSRTTKISVATLRALERNKIDSLPGGIFVRGFLRAYAREVGLDVEETVKRYLAQFEPGSDDVAAAETDHALSKLTPLVHPPIAPKPGVIFGNPKSFENQTRFLYTSRTASMRLLLVALALAIGFAGYIAFRGSPTPLVRRSLGGGGAPPSEVTPKRPTGEHLLAPAAPPSIEAATSGLHDADAPAAREYDGVRIEIRTQAPCWIAATADGVSVAYRLMQAGERETIEARDEVVLTAGDSAAFTYLINDMPGRSLGGPGQVVTVRITTQNYREFVGP
jgi:transcriptional regulator with XRE-family HTH domain